jgi:hypothetical protein
MKVGGILASRLGRVGHIVAVTGSQKGLCCHNTNPFAPPTLEQSKYLTSGPPKAAEAHNAASAALQRPAHYLNTRKALSGFTGSEIS